MSASLWTATRSLGQERVKVVNELVSDACGKRGWYTGDIKVSSEFPHGSGRMQYTERGRSYDGEWLNGRWHGLGHATLSNGDTFHGMYVLDERHGRGVYNWKDGRVYEGEFQHDKHHGRGKLFWPNGALYDGEFVDGQQDGLGMYQFADGGRYEGRWSNGRHDGVGTRVWADGRCYHGEWKAGLAHGQGIATFADGSVRYDGIWSNNEPSFVTPNEELSSGPTVMVHAAGVGLSGSVYLSVGSNISGIRQN